MEITKLDEHLLELLDDASDIETAVLDSEEFTDEITDKIARARRFIDLHTSKRLDTDFWTDSQPVVQMSVVSQPQENTEHVSDNLLVSQTPGSGSVTA